MHNQELQKEIEVLRDRNRSLEEVVLQETKIAESKQIKELEKEIANLKKELEKWKSKSKLQFIDLQRVENQLSQTQSCKQFTALLTLTRAIGS